MTTVEDTFIEKEMQASYIDYAMSVIVGRALPDARDGLKPAQRRILYSMYKLGNTHDQPTKKSARIVGDCIGKFHPHGDIAAYETLVRLAQDFTMNHTLVQGQGNMGSIDGDPPAAQRYTEVRLNRLADEMLGDLEKKAVQFVPNFDNTEEEPVVLPTKVPNLIVNGATGIAVGVATNILPHNLREVCDAIAAYIDNREITPRDLLKYIKGPDFPTGGTAFYTSSLEASYLSGRGSCIVRGRTEVEEKAGRRSIIISEIPYGVNKASMVQKIALLVKEKKLQGISDLRDESSKEGIRVVIELKKEASPQAVLNSLYKHTQLQESMPVINIAVLKNSLITFNIKQMIKVFVDHRVEVIKNRVNYDLVIASDRLHIVEGLLTAINDIDGVVGAIRASADTKEARGALIGKYKLSEKQANAILDMKLSKLTSLERGALEGERTTLTNDIIEYRAILADEGKVYGIIKEETKEIATKYGRDRRTKIDINPEMDEIAQEDLVTDEEVTVILTGHNYMKRLPARIYKSQGRGGRGVRAIELHDGDFVRQVVSCMAKDYLLALTSRGRAYWLKAYVVPEEGRYTLGKAAVNLIKLAEGERVEKIINTREFSKRFIVLITKKGKMKRIQAEKFSRPRASGIMAMPLEEEDALADVCITDGSSEIFIATRNGKALRFLEKDVRATGRGAHGVRGIRLAQGDAVTNIIAAKASDSVATVTERGFGKVTELGEYRLQRRGGKGVINLKVKDKTGHVVKSIKVSPDDQILLMSSTGISIEFPASSVRVTGRAASGVRLMQLEGGAAIVDAQTV